MKAFRDSPPANFGLSGAGLWILGLGGSALAHLAVAAALIPFLDPDPLPQKPSPQSALSMESQQVARSQAQEQRAQAEPGRQIPAEGESLGAGAVQESSARASPPALQPIAEAPSQGEQAATAPTTGTALSTPEPEVEVSLALATPADPAASVAARTQTLSEHPTTAQPVPLSAISAPPVATAPIAAPPLAAQFPTAARAQSQPPAPENLATADPRTENADNLSTQELATSTQPAASEPQILLESATAPHQAVESQDQSEAITAALAFQGGASNDLDPTSVAAFQSFTRPNDPVSQATGLRDGLAGLLGAVPCSRLQAVFDPDSATLELRGHLPENGLRGPVLAALQAQMGRDIAISDKMRLLPRPQCGALSGISMVGLPQSTDQITNPLLLGPDAQARVLNYFGGEQLYFDLTAPDYPAYLYVDYFDAAGNVIHLSPNAHIALARAEPKSAQRVGAKSPQDPGLQITVGPPYGQEIAVAFAASSPLYEGLRPLSEPAEPYLDFLRRKVTENRVQDTDFKGEWVYFLIETQAK